MGRYDRPVRGVFALIVAALVLAAPSAAAAPQLQHVTIIGDSVADAIPLTPSARTIVTQGIDADLEVAPCRRLEGEGCPVDGVRPPSAVQLIQSMGSKLGANVVIAVGYNDFLDQYHGNIDDALAALKAAGVKRVFWLTLREAHHPYIPMNGFIEAAAAKHPEMTVVEWNTYSRSHPDWFQTDGVHLVKAGADAMATLIHKALLAGGVAAHPPRVMTKALPLAHRGKPYRAKLVAASGFAPYRWSLLERAPLGVHLEPTGAIVGTPRAKVGRYTFDVQVRDATGSISTQRLTLRLGA